MSKKSICEENLPEWARGWLAGLLDGEGTITAKHHRRKQGVVNIQPIIVLNNTSLELLRRIKEILRCGTIQIHSPSYTRKHPNRNVVWRLEIKGSFAVYTILKQVYPYLIVKRRHAEIVMKICEENMRAYITNKPANYEYLERLRSELKSLTKRGKKSSVGLDRHP
jgi:LAGLIDADG endonuclease.